MNAVAIDFEQFVQINHSEPVTTSEFVAKAFGKKHCDVLRKIEEICTQVPDSFGERNFALLEKERKNNLGFFVKNKVYELTKDGFILLVMGFTGKNAMSIKIAYINAFNAMAEKLRQIQAQQHVSISHLISKEQADNIQLAVEQRSQRTGESYQKIYAGLHAYLRIDSYKTMPVEHYTAALKYLESVPDAPELFKPAVTDRQVLPNINKDGRWLVIVKNSIATHVENINGYNCINVDVFKKLRMQTKQQAEYLLELAKRMRVIDGECSNSRLDVPIEELHPKFII
ncbi:Rha family transcriptional regulator [Snodgrassella communis]|uniref:Rha family transcriptional regulator n=1 Tax=Snodgrassella communis TaxID=2946699 RepID=UPI00286B0B28|nr:Rha family transcriptional regulator [Snodgrassella communis]WMY91869.1 Rha family transcriptional regulator [Snodgrassella communis]